MKKKAPGSVVTIVLTAITILFWTAYVTYRAISKPVDYQVSPEIVRPFTPILDTATLDNLPQRLYFEEGQIPETILVVELPEEDVVEEVEIPDAGDEPTASPTPDTDEVDESTESANI